MAFNTETKYLSGQGIVTLEEIDAATGLGKGEVDVGNAPTLTMSMATENEDKYESRSGNQLLAKRIPRKKTADVKLSIENCSPAMLAVALYGAANVIASGTVTAEEHPVYLGKGRMLNHPKISSLVVKGTGADSAITYEVGKNYEIDATYGGINVYSDAEQTAKGAANNIADGDVLTFAYSYAGYVKTTAFANTGTEYVLRMKGVNTSESGEKFYATVHRFQPNPLNGFNFISNESTTIELDGAAMADTTRAEGDQFMTLISMT